MIMCHILGNVKYETATTLFVWIEQTRYNMLITGC